MKEKYKRKFRKPYFFSLKDPSKKNKQVMNSPSHFSAKLPSSK
jgi:hypothetical protein